MILRDKLSGLENGLKNRILQKGLVFHSDKVVQSAYKKFTSTIESYGVIRSMSRKVTAGIM